MEKLRVAVMNVVPSEWLVKQALSRLVYGRIVLVEGGKETVYGSSDKTQPQVKVVVNSHNFYGRVLTRQDVGLGESYMDREFDCDDLVLLVEILIQNSRLQAALLPTSYISPLTTFLGGIARWVWRNTPYVSHENVKAHYDLGNSFYELMLDRRTMAYTCAVYNSPNESLEQAQLNKLRLVINKADLRPTDYVVELGCGWGGFALEAARSVGCKVMAVNLSGEQVKYARDRAAAEGLSDKVEFRQMDYRLVEGEQKFDKVVSIGMMEHVGHYDLPTFFKTADRLLKPDGVLVIHMITFLDQSYDRYRADHDFIKEYIFPGCCIPSVTALMNAATQASRFTVQHCENFGANYAKTLHDWRANCQKNAAGITALGYDDKFQRMWDFYLTYCEAAFHLNQLGLHQMVFRRPTVDKPFPLGRWDFTTTPRTPAK